MRVAVTGTTGRVGAALVKNLSGQHEIISLPRPICDLADRSSLSAALDTLECDVLINPAALTSLEACEDDPELASRVNAEAPREMALWAANRGVRLVQISTDYVFEGSIPGLRHEEELPNPQSVYGRSKLSGEQAVLSQAGGCVVRVSWVFGPEKPSFIDQTFDAALAGRPLSAIADKFSLPTSTADLAEWIGALITEKAEGIFHACNSGEPVSWHGMASRVVQEMVSCGTLTEAPEITKLKLDEVPSLRAARPRFSAMDTSRLTAEIGYIPRPWKDAISTYVQQRCSSL